MDTGCRIPFVFRKGLVHSSKLVNAKKPISIRVADGKLMQGGSLGCMAALHISVMGSSGHMTEVKCAPFWGYEAGIDHPDIIIGYPFLRCFRLVVDCPEHCLSAKFFKPTPISILSAEGDRSNKHVNRSKVEEDADGNIHNGPLDADSAQYNSPGEVNPAWSSYPGTGNSFLVVHTLPTSHTSVQMEADGVFSPARFFYNYSHQV